MVEILETDHEKKFLLAPYLDFVKNEGAAGKSDSSIKEGGRQIEHEDQNPRMHKKWLEAIEKTGVTSDMGEFIDETPFQ